MQQIVTQAAANADLIVVDMMIWNWVDVCASHVLLLYTYVSRTW